MGVHTQSWGARQETKGKGEIQMNAMTEWNLKNSHKISATKKNIYINNFKIYIYVYLFVYSIYFLLF